MKHMFDIREEKKMCCCVLEYEFQAQVLYNGLHGIVFEIVCLDMILYVCDGMYG